MSGSAVFSVSKAGERWCVSVDGEALATAETVGLALSLATDAIAIMRKSGLPARLKPLPAAREEPRSFDPK